MYAKIDSEGNVIEFPYRIDEREEIPADAVEVDTETLKPATTWNQALFHDAVTNNNGVYQLSYITGERYTTLEEKKKGISNLKKLYEQQNKQMFRKIAKQLKQGYEEEEIPSWDTQIKEANDFLNGVDITGGLVDKLAQKRGLTLTELTSRIIQKNDQFTSIYGDSLGTFHRNGDILAQVNPDDDTTFDIIDQYGW